MVNATFANNKADLTTSASVPSVYNSVSWNNDTQNLTTDDNNKNVAITRGVATIMSMKVLTSAIRIMQMSIIAIIVYAQV